MWMWMSYWLCTAIAPKIPSAHEAVPNVSYGVYQHLAVRLYDIFWPCLIAHFATFVCQPCMTLPSDIRARRHVGVTNAAAIVK